MTTGQKTAVSLIASTIIALAFSLAAWTGLFNVIETRFYNPRLRRQTEETLAAVTASEARWQDSLKKQFREILLEAYSLRAFLPTQSEDDSIARNEAFGRLMEMVPGLSGVRFIDSEGKRIHYSTFAKDIERLETDRVMYRLYGLEGDEVWQLITATDGQDFRSISLPSRGEIAFSIQLRDEFGVYRGSAVFYVSYQGLLEHLVGERAVGLGETLSPAGGGLVLGFPPWANEALDKRIAELWSHGPNAEPLPIGGTEFSEDLVLFGAQGSSGPLGYLVPVSWFGLSDTLRYFMLAAIFVTVFLLCFLLMNIKQDGPAVLAATIRRLQMEILEEYLGRKETFDAARLGGELEGRRNEVKERIRTASGALGKRHPSEVDALVDRGWDEIVALLSGSRGKQSGEELSRLESLLRDALARGAFAMASPDAGPIKSMEVATRPAETTTELVDAEAIEALAELYEAEPAEDITDIEDIAELDEAEPEGATAVEDLAELDGAEPAEEITELEGATAVEDLAELDEAEPAEEVIELEYAEAGEDLIELEDAEPVQELTELEGAEPVEDLAELGGSVDQHLKSPIGGESDEWGVLSAEALALSADDDDLPVIPESLGLELVEEANLADVMPYLGSGAGSRQKISDGEPLVTEADSSQPESGLLAQASRKRDDQPSLPSSQRPLSAEAIEPLHEVEFALNLGFIDLSALDGWCDEEGFLELDQAGQHGKSEEPQPEVAVAPDASGAFEMLSAEDRDRMEELLVVVEGDGEEPADPEALPDWDSYLGYRPVSLPIAYSNTQIEMLAVEGESEPLELEPENASDQVIRLVDGVFTIDRSALSEGEGDPALKALANEVLRN